VILEDTRVNYHSERKAKATLLIDCQSPDADTLEKSTTEVKKETLDPNDEIKDKEKTAPHRDPGQSISRVYRDWDVKREMSSKRGGTSKIWSHKNCT